MKGTQKTFMLQNSYLTDTEWARQFTSVRLQLKLEEKFKPSLKQLE